jgi:hypothetical protein
MEKHYVICQCMSPEHVLHFTHDIDENEVYVEVYLSHHTGVLARVVTAVKYIFGYKSKYGHFDCTILSQEELKKLQAYLDRINSHDPGH